MIVHSTCETSEESLSLTPKAAVFCFPFASRGFFFTHLIGILKKIEMRTMYNIVT